MAAVSPAPARRADVCMVLEGTYPYVAGGVSSWCHDIIRSLPELGFSLLHIGPKAGSYGAPRYALPDNVTGMVETYCQGADGDAVARADVERTIRAARRQRSATPSRTLAALRRIHLEDTIDDALIADLSAADLSLDALLHGDEAFEVVREIARVRAPSAPFVTLFWHLRSMHVPLLRLIASRAPEASVYHTVSTGYAGVVAAVASHRANKPLLLTEHGIYARERDMELARATWDDTLASGGVAADPRMPATASQLRQLWSTFFLKLSQIAYHRANQIVTLSEVNRTKEIEDGAPPAKIAIVPNGVDVDALAAAAAPATPRAPRAPIRIGFVGRVVPIKDVITFVKACDIAMREVSLDVEIIGPAEEDSAYATRCRELVELLGRTEEIRFVGPKKLAEIYGNLDICVLTSFSEGQPLVILEAHAQAVPVIATDVGACREMLEGRTDEDRALGPGGIVTAVAAPEETAAALIKLARSANLRERMGKAGRERVRSYYNKRAMIDAYRDHYVQLAKAVR